MSRFLCLLIILVYISPLTLFAATIDDFENGDQVISSGPGTNNNSGVATATAVGANRKLRNESFSGLAGTRTTSVVGLGEFSHSQDVTNIGQTRAVWDGSDGGTFNPAGLGGIDLLNDNASAFRLIVNSFDFPSAEPLDITITVYDAIDPSGLTSATASIQLLAAIVTPTNIDIPFNTFVGSVNFANIGAITLLVDGKKPAHDLTIEWFGTNGDCSQIPVAGVPTKDDCGVCGGMNKDKDECGICFGKGKDLCELCQNDPDYNKNLCLDCKGIPNGNALVDSCGVCGGSGPDDCGHCPNDPLYLADECKDCAGVPFGTAASDVCGTCNGDNSACCSIFNTEEIQRRMDNNVKRQEKLIKKDLKELKKKDPSAKKYVQETKELAAELQFEGWTASWIPPSEGTSCREPVATANCFTASNLDILTFYRDIVEQLKALHKQVAKRLKAIGEFDKKNKRNLKKGKKIGNNGILLSNQMPQQYTRDCI